MNVDLNDIEVDLNDIEVDLNDIEVDLKAFLNVDGYWDIEWVCKKVIEKLSESINQVIKRIH